ncbi:hypothetical protein HDU84_009244 [Entophlyctis sp. JEL0112]|nr:hypothetical protein HDU84_009244 [Entophlyctis sp. JEL0112]
MPSALVLAPRKETYVLGRAPSPASDLVIESDKSVSRAHASLSFSPQVREMAGKGAECMVFFCDHGSRLGSMVNGTRVTAHVKVPLRAGSEIRLGATGATSFVLKHVPAVVSFSGMKTAVKDSLANLARGIGFVTRDELDAECTHLVMSTLKITLKTVLALAQGTKIVNDSWLKAVESRCDAVNASATMGSCGESASFSFPNEEMFVPLVKEDNIPPHFFFPNSKRTSLFSKHKFLFVDATEFRSFSPIVTRCGGIAEDCSNAPITIDSYASILARSTQYFNLVISDAGTTDQRFVGIVNHVNSKDDIIYSLLHTSTDNYLKSCKLVGRVSLPVNETERPSKSILAESVADESSNTKVPASLDDDSDNLFGVLFKRKRPVRLANVESGPPDSESRTNMKSQNDHVQEQSGWETQSSEIVKPNMQEPRKQLHHSEKNAIPEVPRSNLLSQRLGLPLQMPTAKKFAGHSAEIGKVVASTDNQVVASSTNQLLRTTAFPPYSVRNFAEVNVASTDSLSPKEGTAAADDTNRLWLHETSPPVSGEKRTRTGDNIHIAETPAAKRAREAYFNGAETPAVPQAIQEPLRREPSSKKDINNQVIIKPTVQNVEELASFAEVIVEEVTGLVTTKSRNVVGPSDVCELPSKNYKSFKKSWQRTRLAQQRPVAMGL